MTSKHWAIVATVCQLIASTVGCAKHIPLAPPAAPLTKPTRLCGSGEAAPHCRSAPEIEALLAGPGELLGIADTPSGMQGAKILTLQSEAKGRQVVLRAKWRPQSSGDLINEPRKEIAAYGVQKLFLDDAELVAPPTVARCIPLAEYRRFVPKEAPSFQRLDCVLGFASYWLEGVKTVSAARKADLLGKGEGIWDAQLFERDSTYRSSISHGNLLTYLINHGDMHDEQFVLETTPRGLRAYVVDNSIAFRSIKNPMLLVRQDWSRIQVPWLSARAVERLRALTDDDFARLSTVSELERRGDQLVAVDVSKELPHSDGTPMSWNGTRLRFGLTPGEIDLVRSQVQALLKRDDLENLIAPRAR